MTETLQPGSIHVADVQHHAFLCRILHQEDLKVCNSYQSNRLGARMKSGTNRKNSESYEIIDWTELVKRSSGGQQGIIFGKGEKLTRLLMSKREGAPYLDKELDGIGIIYEGEDVKGDAQTKKRDQELTIGNRGLFDAAIGYLEGKRRAEPVRIFEKLSKNRWVDLGELKLVGVSKVFSEGRYVYRFQLSAGEEETELIKTGEWKSRNIASEVRENVWKRDGGQCAICGSRKDLHFDHIIPWSEGGSNSEENIRVLCSKCNIKKSARIGDP
jgi:hypothetical protein